MNAIRKVTTKAAALRAGHKVYFGDTAQGDSVIGAAVGREAAVRVSGQRVMSVDERMADVMQAMLTGQGKDLIDVTGDIFEL